MAKIPSGKSLIVWVILGTVGLLILGALGYGPGTWIAELGNTNADRCTSGFQSSHATCTGANLTANAPVELIAGTIIPIIFFVAVALKFL